MPVKTRTKSRTSRTRPPVSRRVRRLRHAPGFPDDGGQEKLQARLGGFHEVPPVLTGGSGAFQARLSDDGTSIEYELTFSNLTSPATVAHLHFGQPGVNGEIFAFLCGGDDAPSCPGQGGRVSGTITADDIVGIPSQGLAEGDFAGALRIIRAGLAYVNVHSTTFPGGEIRGQVRHMRI